MSKKVLKNLMLVTVMAILYFAVAVTASAEASINGFTYTISNNEATITGYDGAETDLVIPDEIEGYPVTTVEERAFYGCINLKSVVIPDSITEIGSYAFYDCTKLETVVLSENITVLKKDVFGDCMSLQSINIPDGVKTIEEYAFNRCANLKEIQLPNSLETIERRAFSICVSLSSIEIPESVVSVGELAFKTCISLNDIYIRNKDLVIDAKSFGYTASILHEGVTLEALLNWFNEDYSDTDGEYYTYGDILYRGDARFYDIVEEEYLNKYVQFFGTDYQKLNDTLIHCYRESSAKEYAVANDVDYVCFDHLYVETVIKDATCMEEGEISFICECGDSYTETISKLEGHTYETIITEPTCTAKGYTTYTCECGDTYVADYVDASGHSYEAEVTTEPTHLAEGEETYTCTCGDSYTKPVVKLEGHTYEKVITEPTCTAKGYTTYICKCGDTYIKNYMDIIDHTFTEWMVEGDKLIRYCTNCTLTETKINTDEGDIEIVAPENPDDDFDADEVESDDEKYILVEEAFEENHESDYEILKVFDINLKNKDGVHIQPDGTVKVKLPLDWTKNGNYKVYRVNDDGTLTDMNAYRQGSHMVFDTDHFSLYVIVDESEKADESAENNCSCNCHKKGFLGFIWKIILFFQKLFKTNKTCKCGIAHY